MIPWTIAAAPEEVGLSSQALLDFLDAAKSAGITMHSLMLIKDGTLAASVHAAPYTAQTPHICYSMTKPFTSLAAGFAVQEGLLHLDDRVIDVLREQAPEHPDPWLSEVTLHHLLSMSSGLCQKSDNINHIFSPDALQEDWARATLAFGCDAEPGSIFRYNSHGSYLISCMVQKVTGMPLNDYLLPRLFAPLGIEKPRYDTSPQGICCGGWGMYLPCEDIAKVGLCLLQGGKWNGVQILPEEWLPLATKEHIPTNTVPRHREWAQGYGYHLWRMTDGRFRGDGTDGQFMIVSPRQNMVLAATADTKDLTGEHDLFDEYLFNEARWVPSSPETQQALRDRIAELAR